MNLLDSTDIAFILNQLRLLGNDPRTTQGGTILDPRGIREVQGIGNNLLNPSWGNADTLFPRLTQQHWQSSEGTFTFGRSGLAVNPTPTSYSVRDVNVVDSNPRVISNLVANQASNALSAIGLSTEGQQKLAVMDDPSATPGGRLSPLTGADNPLPYSSYMTLFGQFFDHGLDLVQKGKDGSILVQLLPGDPLYNDARSAIKVGGQVVGHNNFLVASRTNTVHVEIGRSSSDTLISALGLTEDRYTAGDAGFTVGRVTGSAPVGDVAEGGVILLNNRAIEIAPGSDAADVVAAINADTKHTGVTASLDAQGTLLLDYRANESINVVSPFVDLSQAYGSEASHSGFLREYASTNGLVSITGRLASGADRNGDGLKDGMPTWADIKDNARIAGVILHDKDVLDIPLLRVASNGSPFVDSTPGNGGLWLVSRDQVTGQVYYVRDSLVSANTSALRLEADGTTTLVADADFAAIKGSLLLQTVGTAFLADMAHGVMSSLSAATGDLADPAGAALLNAHFISGDGRTNENLGLTAIHEVFHAEHNRVLGDIQVMVYGGMDSSGVTHTARADAATWTGEELFQAAKLATEMQYQHLVFAEFARKFSPNINAFAAYDVTIDPGIAAEFAHAVYRFGHSMLTETVDIKGFNAATGLANGEDHSMGLIQAFLNPGAYTDQTAGEIALGMSRQVGNAIDEWVTDSLRNNLVGLPLDLATLNIVRGRDTGMGSLNEVRADLYAQTNLASLKPYASWDEFSLHLVHPESLQNFVMAYARDAILTQFGTEHTLQEWNALQASGAPEYAEGLRAAAQAAIADDTFVNGNTGLNAIDFWLGGLAETKVPGGMLGSTFDFIFATQMIQLQNADRFYYLNRLGGTNLLASIDTQLFSDLVMRNTGVKHLYSDIFSVPDASVEIGDAKQSDAAGSVMALAARTSTAVDIDGVAHQVSKAGWVFDGTFYTFYGNPGDYLDARGVFSPNNNANLTGNVSETLGGTDLAERINALGGNDTVWGDGGHDTIEGGSGSDFLHGGDGNDLVTDAQGDDMLWGDAGNDTLDGGAGIDLLFGGRGDDVVRGGLGADALDGGLGDDVLYGDSGALTPQDFAGVTIQVMDATGGADVMDGGDGDDTLYGGGGDDVMDGAEGDDVLVGGLGNDGMAGGFGNDRFVMDASDIGYGNAMDGGMDTDTVDYSLSAGRGPLANGERLGVKIDLAPIVPVVVPVPGPPAPDALSSIEHVIGSAYNDDIRGGAQLGLQQNLLMDEFGAPINFGTELVPIYRTSTITIDGGAGNDTIEGGDGVGRWQLDPATGHYAYSAAFDPLSGGPGADVLKGGAGIDTVSYASAASSASIAGAVPTAAPVATPNVTGVAVDLRIAGVQNTLNAGLDLLSGFENITGSGFNDTLTGDALANVLSGLAGDDSLLGDAGDDTLVGGAGNDRLDGGLGVNTASYIGAGSTAVVVGVATAGVTGVRVSLAVATAQDTLNDGVDTLVGISNLIGSTFNDTLTGNAAANRLAGDVGNDLIVGGDGNDTLLGGAGTDRLDGGLGVDTASWADANGAVTASLLTNLATGAAGTDTLVSIENLEGSAFNDSLTGSAINNTLNGGAGDDLILAGQGNDVVLGGLGNDTVQGESGDDNLDGGAGNDRLDGGAGNDILFGGLGNDLLTGGDGNDTLRDGSGVNTLTGGLGNDLYILAAGDTPVEAVGGGVDSVQTALAALTLAANLEHLTYTGSAAFTGVGNAEGNQITGGIGNDVLSGLVGNDVLTGAAGNDQLNGGDGDDQLLGGVGNDTLDGGAANDLLDGGAGLDVMAGGAGDDTYVVDVAGDGVTELAAAGTDTVRTGLTSYALGAHLENLASTGTLAFSGTGNELNNIITGGAAADILSGGFGNDTLNGAAGNDQLHGEAGNDWLDGGLGSDVMTGGLGDDTYVIDVLTDTVVEQVNGGNDTIQTALRSVNLSVAAYANVESIVFTGTVAASAGLPAPGTSFVGNALHNSLGGSTGNDQLTGNDGNDTLNGGSGNDTLNGGAGDDLLNGGAGTDAMTGGLGNDLYDVDVLADVVTEQLNQGVDTVRTALAAYTLGANVENLDYTGALTFAGTGNALNNVISGGASADTLNGGAGNDTISGAAGNDVLIGGAGTDVLTGGFGADRFVFSSVTDSVATAGLRDIIADFTAAADRIDLSAIDANTVTLNKQGFTWLGTGAITGAGQLNMAFDAATGHTLIRGNVNADVAPDFVIMLAGDYTASLTATDFLLG